MSRTSDYKGTNTQNFTTKIFPKMERLRVQEEYQTDVEEQGDD